MSSSDSFSSFLPAVTVDSQKPKQCLLCNLEIGEGETRVAVSGNDVGSTFEKDKILFCKLFNISLLENEFDFERVGPFCQFCVSNVTKLCNLERQLRQLKMRLNQMQIQIVNCVVNSFASTNYNQKGYMVKRQIYEGWFERCHQAPGITCDWESRPMPSGPTTITKTPAPIGSANESDDFNIRLVPVEQLVSKSTNDCNGKRVNMDIQCSSTHPVIDDRSCSGDEPEIVFEPENPVLPLPCVIKRIKKHKLNKHNTKRRKFSNKLKKKKVRRKSKAGTNECLKIDSNKVLNEYSNNKYSPPSTYSAENSPPLSPAGILYSEDPQELEMPPSSHSEFSQVNTTLDDNCKNIKPPTSQVSDLRITEVRKITGDDDEGCNKQSVKGKSTQKEKSGVSKMDPDGFICQFCGKSFSQKCKFDAHVRTHTGERPYKCKICRKGYYYEGNVMAHERTHDNTQLSAKRPFKCPICQMGFRDEIYVQMHQSIHSSENLIYQCTNCGRGFQKRNKLNWHLKKVHKILEYANYTAVKRKEDCIVDTQKSVKVKIPVKRVSKVKLPKEKQKRGKKPNTDLERLKCKICQKVSKTFQSHMVHARSHTGEKPFKCKYCDKTFNDEGNKKKHEGTHDNERLNGEPKHECKVCGKKYYLQGSLYHHSRKKHSETLPKCYDKVKCEICGLILSSRKGLLVHIKRRHSDNKLNMPYQCMKCMRCFSNEFVLQIHETDHADRTPIIETDEFKCVHCPTLPFKQLLSFSKEALLKHYAKEHLEVASNDVPLKPVYKCPKCPLKLSRKTEILHHYATVHEKNRRNETVQNKRNVRQIKSKKSQIRLNDSDSETEIESEEYHSFSEEKITGKMSTDLQHAIKSPKSVKRELSVRRSTRVINSETKVKNEPESKSVNTNSDQPFANFNLKQLRIVLHKIDANQNSADYDLIDIKE